MYVEGYVLSVPEGKKAAYVAIAKIFADVAKDFGAIEIFENWEVEVPAGEQTDFRRAVRAGSQEKIVFSWVIWPDQATSAIAHKGMMKDPRMTDLGDMPFDGKHMIMGGFAPIVRFQKETNQTGK